MNHCDTCEFADKCELANGINFCEDCKDCKDCPIKSCVCDAGHYIECNNGFEIEGDCYADDDELECEEELEILF